MPLNWNRGPLAEGLHCYRAGQFFETHEHWESVWLTLSGPEKTFLQSLIQIAAAFHHLKRNNPRGAQSLLSRALRRLTPYPPHYAGIAVEPLRQNLQAWLDTLNQPIPSLHPPYPTIR
jgi:hypothetical protein